MMHSQNMLYLQEDASPNTARVLRVDSLTEALDAMIKIYVEIKFKMEGQRVIMIDLEQALQYYQRVQELRFYEQAAPQEMAPETTFGFQMKNVKVFNKTALLNELVDYLITKDNPEDDMSNHK